ncbi:oxidoreductase [Actinomadura sp. NBRC 104412]|nr:oxidoreductase [Actinomadura sp. NBRC 104412]
MLPRMPIGGQGLTGPVLGLGCMALSVYYGGDTAAADPERVIGAALDAGVTLLDTADAYGWGENERVVGRAIAGRRDEVVLSTKFGRAHPDRAERDVTVGRPEYVARACEESLRRLDVDHIDVYIYHRVDPTVPVEDTVGALAALVDASKVRFIGLSEVGPETVRRAHAVHPLSLVQNEFSLLTREPERTLLPVLRELGITLVAYSPLHRGLLAGHVRSAADLADGDWRGTSPRFQGGNLRANLALVERLRPIAARYDLSLAQLALGWVMATEALPLQGATTVGQLRENVAAANVTLPPEVITQLDRAMPVGAAAGERADPGYLRHVLAR